MISMIRIPPKNPYNFFFVCFRQILKEFPHLEISLLSFGCEMMPHMDVLGAGWTTAQIGARTA